MQKICFVNIALRPPPSRRTLPLGLAYVMMAVRRAGYTVELLDLAAQPRNNDAIRAFFQDRQFDVAMFGCIVTGYRHVRRLCRQIRESSPRTAIVVGNSVAGPTGRLLLERTEANYAVGGEGEMGALTVLSNGADKEAKCIIPPSAPLDLGKLPCIDWSLFDIADYMDNYRLSPDEPTPPVQEIRAMPINTARGCPYRCSFCYHCFKDMPYRRRPAKQIVAEMACYSRLYGANLFLFWDELTFSNSRQVSAFLDVLEEYPLFYWGVSVCSDLFSCLEHAVLLERMKALGCLRVFFSLESSSPEILRQMNKRTTVEQFERQVRLVQAAGLAVHTSLVVGYPTETPETIRHSIRTCQDLGIYPSVGYLLPQPGTPIFDYARRHGHIGDVESYLLSMGDRQDLLVNLTKMPDETLIGVTQDALADCARTLGIALKDLLKTGSYKMRGKG